MLSIMTESISNSSFAIYFPKFTGTIFELLSAPVSYIEVVLGYVGAAATKSVIIGSIILGTPAFLVTEKLRTRHHGHVPVADLRFVLPVWFIWADGWEKLTIVPTLVIMPLTFLGGTFYSISMLPPVWQTSSLFNPVVYLISGFRWSLYENADVSVALSLTMTIGFLGACLLAVRWIFQTGYTLRN